MKLTLHTLLTDLSDVAERLGEVVEHARDGLGLLLLGELPMLLVLSAPLLVFERAAVVHSATSMPNFF